MGLSVISDVKRDMELEIQNSINGLIDINQNFVFDSGAGSGKTYALAESIKHVIVNHGERLLNHNQRIVCITYTNVATEEVKTRLDNNELVWVSTIHERIWGLIKGYQKELVEIHKEKLIQVVQDTKESLNHEKYKKYNDLSPEMKNEFELKILNLKKEFYSSYDLKSKEFKNVFIPLLEGYGGLLSNVANFKSLVTKLYRINNLNITRGKIDEGELKRVDYTPRINNDRLHAMQFSHDTLLEYGKSMFQRYEVLRKIVINKFPYIFIDEYQDTNSNVIDIMTYLSKSSEEINHPICIGYFGDSAQNIYESGVGSNLKVLHSDLNEIIKKYNRRSASEIVDIINKIRSDNIKQESIYEDSECGIVEFYQGSVDSVDAMIDKCIDDWEINDDNSLNCLVLTNKAVAERSGIGKFYDTISKMPRYKVGTGFMQLNTELLSPDLSKLGIVQRTLFELIDRYVIYNNENTPIFKVIPKDIIGRLNINDLRLIVSKFTSIQVKTFKEYLDELIKLDSNLKNTKFKDFIKNMFPDQKLSIESIERHIIDLFSTTNDDDATRDEELELIKQLILELYSIDMQELIKWHKMIKGNDNSDINYFTYHGTKGLEFDNMLVLLEKKFGQRSNYFGYFFENYSNRDQLSDESLSQYESVRNLIYVACSRAKLNLRIMILDELGTYRSATEEIFGEIKYIE